MIDEIKVVDHLYNAGSKRFGIGDLYPVTKAQ
jgi:hypothetical protein